MAEAPVKRFSGRKPEDKPSVCEAQSVDTPQPSGNAGSAPLVPSKAPPKRFVRQQVAIYILDLGQEVANAPYS